MEPAARLTSLVELSRQLTATRRRTEKVERLAELLRRLPGDEVGVAVAYLSGALPQGRIGLGYAQLRAALRDEASGEPRLTLREVNAAFDRIRGISGAGSVREKVGTLRELLRAGTRAEQEFLMRLVLGELRQGALEGIMVEAIARAASLPAADVRRAVMVSDDMAAVARAALERGAAGLEAFSIRPLHPIQPMLARRAEDLPGALSQLGDAVLEYKLDGARVQVHKQGGEVRVFSRQCRDVTTAVPELVELARSLPADALILDGETLALREGGRPHPFQLTMRRFGRKRDDARLRAALPLTTFFFDCLYLDGASLLDREARDRFAALERSVPDSVVVPRVRARDRSVAESFSAQAWERGHEGLMVKSLSAPYDAGSRGGAWLKVKRAHTLDLVVLGAEWGSGRRRGFLSNLHLGARDAASGELVMLGKTFKGMTDSMLAWQTERLLALEAGRDRWTVYVKPELVVEVAFSDVQASAHYPGGLALRFARVKGYRQDKTPEQADTFDAVKAIYAAQAG